MKKTIFAFALLAMSVFYVSCSDVTGQNTQSQAAIKTGNGTTESSLEYNLWSKYLPVNTTLKKDDGDIEIKTILLQELSNPDFGIHIGDQYFALRCETSGPSHVVAHVFNGSIVIPAGQTFRISSGKGAYISGMIVKKKS